MGIGEFIVLVGLSMIVIVLVKVLYQKQCCSFDTNAGLMVVALFLDIFTIGLLFAVFIIVPVGQLDVYRGRTALKITKEVVDGKVVKLDSTVIYKNK